MSNNLNKITFACKITTKNSTETYEPIGLYGGVFKYVTGGYVVDGDTYEGGGAVEADWNTDLASVKGVGSMGSSIDIISGGDYSFLQDATIELINMTSEGKSVHKTIESIEGLSPSGAIMQNYVIINKVWYPRWSGLVTRPTFNESTYTFIGGDAKSNASNTLTATILGLVNAESEYKPLGDIKVQNLIAFRMDKADYGEYTNWRRTKSGSNFGQFTGYDKFTGVGRNTNGMISKRSVKHSVEFITGGSLGENIPRIGDILKYESDSTLYTILDVRGFSGGNSPTTLNLNVASLDKETTDYTFLFGDPNNQFYGDIHDDLDTIKTQDSGEKLYFTIYKAVSNTGISAESLEDDGTVTVVNDEGTEFVFPYIINEAGGIVVTQPVASNIVKPIKVEYFAKEENIFSSITGRDWTNFETALSSDAIEIGSFLNDMNPDSPMVKLGGEEGDFNKFLYFNLTFNESDLEGRNDLQLGTLIKGIFDEDNQAWEAPANDPHDWWYYTSKDQYSSEDVVDPEYPTSKKFSSATELAATQAQFTVIETYKIVKDLTYGRIPVFDKSFKLPNVVENNDTWSNDWDGSTDTNHGQRVSFVSSSIPATNLPNYDNKAITIWDNTFNYRQQNITGDDSTISRPSYAQSVIDSDATACKSNTVELLVCVYGFTEDEVTLRNLSDDSSSSVQMTDTQRYTAMFNGFCLFDTTNVDEDEAKLKYRADSGDETGTYVELLKSLTNNEGDYSDIEGTRQDWNAGVQITESEQRYSVVTKLCKQGFVAGFTGRSGIDTYKEVGVKSESFIEIDNSITLDESIKNFTTSSPAKIYNEFEITGQFETLSIKNVGSDSFPALGEDYSDYVTGEDDFYKARGWWNKARSAYLVSSIIHKAPSDRTLLKFASSGSNKDYLTIGTDAGLIIGYPDISEEAAIQFDGNAFDIGEKVNVGDIVELYDSEENGYVQVQIIFKNATVTPSIVNGLILDTNIIGAPASFTFDTSKSWSGYVEGNKYRDEYVDKLLDWTVFPKLLVNFSLPITPDTIKYNLMDFSHFSDTLITPSDGEFGEGWITKYLLNPKTSEISCQVTFTPSFLVVPSGIYCDYIVEATDNVDEIIEHTDNEDEIIEGTCG